jgi:hypothetical protein
MPKKSKGLADESSKSLDEYIFTDELPENIWPPKTAGKKLSDEQKTKSRLKSFVDWCIQ